MATHTPGPWIVVDAVPDACVGYRAIVSEDGELICNPSPMGAANAALIASSPALLAALIEARAQLAREIGLPVEQCVGGHFAPINAAIASAEGKQ